MARRLGAHLTEEQWRGLVSGELDRDTQRRGIRHLLAGCEPCQQLASRVLVAHPILLLGHLAKEQDISRRQFVREFTAMLGSVPEQRLKHANEKTFGLGQWAYLASLTPDERRDTIRSNPAFQTVGLYERFLELSRWAHRYNVQQSIELAELAHTIAESLSPSEYPPTLLADYQARALAHVANANRIAGNVLVADVSLRSAWNRLSEGTGDPKEEALLHRHQANLALELRHFEEAFQSYTRAYDLYVRVDEVHMQGRTLIQQSMAIGFLDPPRGLELAQVGLSLLDSGVEPRAELCGRHQVVHCLIDMDRIEEAAVFLDISRRLYKQFGDVPTMARLSWLEARLSRAKGHLYEAELILRHIWVQFEKQHLPIDLTLLTIDLIEVYVAQGKTEEAITLCDKFYPALREYRMHREGLAMWILLKQAVAGERFRENVFKEMARYYFQAWREPLEQVH